MSLQSSSINRNYVNYILDKLSLPESYIHVNEKTNHITCTYKPDLVNINEEFSEKNALVVFKFIQNIVIKPTKIEQRKISLIKQKLLDTCLNNHALHQKINDHYNTVFGKKEKQNNVVDADEISSRITVKLSNLPNQFDTFCAHIDFAVKHYPKYQLDKHLALIDKTYQIYRQICPPATIREKLLKELGKYAHLKSSAKYQTLCDKIEILRSALKPKSIIAFCLIIHNELRENGAMFMQASNAISQNIPLVLTKRLFWCHKPEFIKQFKNKQVFQQTNGAFLIVLPERSNLKNLGFNEQHITRCNNFNFIQSEICHFANDIDTLLLDDSKDLGYYRIIPTFGHGVAPLFSKGKITRGGEIAGVPVSHFQQGFNILQTKKNMIFQIINSCKLGGVNSSALQSVNGLRLCTIIAESGMQIDSYSNHNNNYTMSMDEALNRSFHPFQFSATQLHLKQLSFNDVKAIAKNLPFAQNFLKIHNLATWFLPSHSKETPKTSKIVAAARDLFDADEYSKQLQAQGIKHSPDWQLKSNFSICLLSRSSIPAVLHSTSHTPLAFMSKGANSHHVIKGLDIPNQEFEKLIENTLNIFQKNRDPNEPILEQFSKLFLFGFIQCHYKNKPVQLNHVVINLKPNMRTVMFQLPHDNYYTVWHYAFSASAMKWVKTAKTHYNHPDIAMQFIYKAIAMSTPKKRMLDQTACGKDSNSEFFEHLNTLFWNQAVPTSALLFQSILNNAQVFYKNDSNVLCKKSTFDAALDKIREELSDKENHSIAKIVLASATEFAAHLKKTHLVERLKNPCLFPLLESIILNQTSKADELITTKPWLIAESDLEDQNPLQWAIKLKNDLVIQALVKSQKIDESILIDALDQTNIKTFDLLLNQYVPTSAKAEFALLEKASRLDRVDIVELLLKKGVAKKYWNELLADAVRNGKHAIIPLFATLSSLSLQQIYPNGKSFLTFAVANNDLQMVQVLLQHKCSPLILDSCGNNGFHTALFFLKEDRALEFIKIMMQPYSKPIVCIKFRDKDGNTALDLAYKYKQEKVIAYLSQQ